MIYKCHAFYFVLNVINQFFDLSVVKVMKEVYIINIKKS